MCEIICNHCLKLLSYLHKGGFVRPNLPLSSANWTFMASFESAQVRPFKHPVQENFRAQLKRSYNILFLTGFQVLIKADITTGSSIAEIRSLLEALNTSRTRGLIPVAATHRNPIHIFTPFPFFSQLPLGSHDLHLLCTDATNLKHWRLIPMQVAGMNFKGLFYSKDNILIIRRWEQPYSWPIQASSARFWHQLTRRYCYMTVSL